MPVTDDGQATPPTLLAIDAYLLSLSGKAGRTRIGDRLAQRGLRLWHMAILAALADFGPHAQRDLCTRLSVDPSDMAKAIEQLADAGSIERTRDAADRRRVLISITGPGRAALGELVRDAAEVDRDLLFMLTADEVGQLHTLLLKVFGAPRAATPPRPPRPPALPRTPPSRA